MSSCAIIWKLPSPVISQTSLSGRPIFAPPLAQLALVGAFYLLVRAWRDVRLAVLSVWFLVGLSGVALTVETPDYLRSMGILPSLCFILAIPLIEVIDRCLSLKSARNRVVMARTLPTAAAVLLLTPEVVGYFATFKDLPSGWAPETHDGEVVRAMGVSGPVYSLEMNEHMVSSGWVRLLAPWVMKIGDQVVPDVGVPAVVVRRL